MLQNNLRFWEHCLYMSMNCLMGFVSLDWEHFARQERFGGLFDGTLLDGPTILFAFECTLDLDVVYQKLSDVPLIMQVNYSKNSS